MAPARNRVTPFGDIEAFPLRGAYTGNRGILHCGREIVRFHQHDSWVTCALRFKDRHHMQWEPHHFTWLFFHDEAVAFAAGHRPCAECRREAYKRYQAAWADALGGPLPSAKEMNRRLHAERLIARTHRRRYHEAQAASLPAGTFVVLDQAPHLLTADAAVEWTRAGYSTTRPRPRGRVTVITPLASVAVLRSGYRLA
jgi:hypothetical protein